MGIVRTTRAARGTLAILMLAPFLMGANHCVIGAVRGDTQMRCLQVSPDAAPAAEHACCHADRPGRADHDRTPALSCCILVGPVPADVQAPAPVAADLGVVPVESTVQEATTTDIGWPVAEFERPPQAPPGASHSSRAPPLA